MINRIEKQKKQKTRTLFVFFSCDLLDNFTSHNFKHKHNFTPNVENSPQQMHYFPLFE